MLVPSLCANSPATEPSPGPLVLTEDRGKGLELCLCRAVLGVNCGDCCLIVFDSVSSSVSPVGSCVCVLDFSTE